MATSEPDPKAMPAKAPPMGIPAPPPGTTTYQGLQASATVPWSTGICDCFPNYFGRFCVSLWCPCYTFGQISEIVDQGSSSCSLNGAIYVLIAVLTGHACCYSMVYRMKMRNQYALDGSAFEDCICHWLCEPCALTQEYLELKNRGFDPSVGWVGSAERRDRGVAMAPVVEPGMKR